MASKLQPEGEFRKEAERGRSFQAVVALTETVNRCENCH
jgi:hypothetical protein